MYSLIHGWNSLYTAGNSGSDPRMGFISASVMNSCDDGEFVPPQCDCEIAIE